MEQNNWQNGPQIRAIKLNIFSLLAFICGLMAIFSITTLIASVVLGSLAIIFAVLSKGGEKKFDPVSRNGFGLGLTALLISLVLILTVVTLYLYNPEYHEKFNQLYEELYGVSLDEYTEQIFSGSSVTGD